MEQSQVMDMYNRMVAKCWADAEFKARLLANPAEVLKAEGVELPAGIEFRIVENTPTVQYWVLPLPPKEAGELDDEQLSVTADSNLPVLGRNERAFSSAPVFFKNSF